MYKGRQSQNQSLDEYAALNDKEFGGEFGFTEAEAGKVSYEGGLLTAAQLGQRKKYPITILKEPFYKPSPDVLKTPEVWRPEGVEGIGDTSYSTYLKTLKNNTQNKSFPIKERFVVAGDHWFAGYIEINENKEVNLFFPDYSDSYQAEFIGSLQVIFSDYKCKVYFGNQKRQFVPAGCSLFALDDVQHLFTVEKYLETKYTSLFDYLEKNQSFNSQDALLKSYPPYEHFTACRANLPLHLLRTKMSTKLEAEIEERSGEEKQQKVNKKGASAQDEYRTDFKYEKAYEKDRNVRLKRKRDQIKSNNIKYINSKTLEKINKDISDCTVDGFITRFSQKTNQENVTPLNSIPETNEAYRIPDKHFSQEGELINSSTSAKDSSSSSGSMKSDTSPASQDEVGSDKLSNYDLPPSRSNLVIPGKTEQLPIAPVDSNIKPVSRKNSPALSSNEVGESSTANSERIDNKQNSKVSVDKMSKKKISGIVIGSIGGGILAGAAIGATLGWKAAATISPFLALASVIPVVGPVIAAGGIVGAMVAGIILGGIVGAIVGGIVAQTKYENSKGVYNNSAIIRDINSKKQNLPENSLTIT